MQTWTSSFLQTSLEFFRVLRLGSVLQLKHMKEMWRKKKVVMKANKACFNKKGVGAHEHLNTNTSALDK